MRFVVMELMERFVLGAACSKGAHSSKLKALCFIKLVLILNFRHFSAF